MPLPHPSSQDGVMDRKEKVRVGSSLLPAEEPLSLIVHSFIQHSPHTRHGAKCYTRTEEKNTCAITHG